MVKLRAVNRLALVDCGMMMLLLQIGSDYMSLLLLNAMILRYRTTNAAGRIPSPKRVVGTRLLRLRPTCRALRGPGNELYIELCERSKMRPCRR